MRITGLKTNHLTNPLGYEIRKPRVSFQVTDTEAKKPEAIRIVAALDEDFEEIVYDSGRSARIQMIGTNLQIAPKPRTRYYWKAEVWGDNGEYAVSDAAWFETAKMEEAWEGKWIGTGRPESGNPVLVKEFTAKKDYKSARIYVTGLGLYRCIWTGSG